MAAATISSTVLRLPAAALGPESPLPAFRSLQQLPDLTGSSGIPAEMRGRMEWGRLKSPLPYALQEDYELDRRMVDLPAVTFANDRVSAVVLPRCGGRIWSLRQLSSGRDLVYRNPVLSWANLALTNAWFAGGVEWNLGSTGHAATTSRPLYAASVETASGPVLRLWEWERTRDLVFSVDLSLPPGSEYLYASVRVRNPDPWVKPLYWWTNVAVAETPGLRVLAPASQAWRNTDQDALVPVAMPQPDEAGPDVSYPSRSPQSADYFFQIEPQSRPWIAAVGADGTGVVHTSTAELRGRKLFVWGVGPGGDRWQERLSGPGHRYLEIQAGLATTQFEHLALAAGGQVSWTEAIGPVVLAADDAHQEWAAAGRAVEAALADRLPAREVEDFHQHWLTSVADQQPEAPMHRGSGFGAAELAVRRTPADHYAATPFTDAKEGSGQLPIPPVSAVWQSYFGNRPRSWRAWLMLAIRAHAGGDLAAARRHYRESLALGPSMIALRGLALISSVEGDHAAAAETYLAAVALDPHCRALLVEAIDALLVADRAATALELIAAAPPEVAGHGRVVLQQIRALLAIGDRTAAARLLQQGIDVPDLREGESIEAVWRLACPGVDLPSRYDFRMHATEADPIR